MLGKYDTANHHWLLNSDGSTGFGSWGPGGHVQPTIPLGTWVHLATTFDGTTLKSYVNGVLQQSVPASFNLTKVGGHMPLNIGLRNISIHPDESDFNGVIDDVRVYKVALSGGDVAQVFANTLPANANLVEWLTFDAGKISWASLTVEDSSSRNNDGDLSKVPVRVPGG